MASDNNKLILIADDDTEDQELLTEAFLKIDMTARVALVANGKEVMDYLDTCPANHLPQAILLDYSMPYLSGAQVLAKLLEQPRFSAIPKFVWSTSSSARYMEECIGNGALDYFVKPDSPGKLLEIAGKILKASGGS